MGFFKLELGCGWVPLKVWVWVSKKFQNFSFLSNFHIDRWPGNIWETFGIFLFGQRQTNGPVTWYPNFLYHCKHYCINITKLWYTHIWYYYIFVQIKSCPFSKKKVDWASFVKVIVTCISYSKSYSKSLLSFIKT
jgi:hypothetical protein